MYHPRELMVNPKRPIPPARTSRSGRASSLRDSSWNDRSSPSTLERGTHVYPEDIEAWEKKAGVKISAGDAIFLRTGRWASGEQLGSGYDVTVAPWLKARDVALVGSDGTQGVGTVEGIILPFHKFVLVALGANIFDNADLERVAETAARLNRWEFLLVAAPIPNPGGTGSPLNPLAIF